MPYQVSGCANNRVFCIHWYGELIANDIRESYDVERHFLQMGRPPVYTIINTTHLDSVAIPSKDLKTVLKFQPHPNRGWVFLVSNHQILHFLTSIIAQKTEINYRHFDSIDEALQLIARLDHTLRNLTRDDIALDAEA